MIGLPQRDHADRRFLCGRRLNQTHDPQSVIESQRFIDRGVKQQRWTPNGRDLGREIMAAEIVQHFRADRPRQASDRYFSLAARHDFGIHPGQQFGQVLSVTGCRDRYYCLDSIAVSRIGQRCSAAETMSNERGDWSEVLIRETDCSVQIGQIGREVGVGKIAVTSPQAGHVKSQNRDAKFGEATRNPHNRLQVFVAGKAMRKDDNRKRFKTVRLIDDAGEFESGTTRDSDSIGFSGHGRKNQL